MLWLYFALLAYFINAVAFVIDKHLLSSSIPKPFAYAFGVSILSVLALILIPFGVFWPGFSYFGIAFVSGGAFFLALIFLYKAIKLSDVSVATTNVATISAICTYLFSVLILNDQLTSNHEFAFVLLVGGIIFLGLIKIEILKHSILAGILMGLSIVLLKWTFNSSDLINGILWTRIGFIGSAFAVLVSRSARKEIYHSFSGVPHFSLFVFVLNKVIAGTGFIVYYYAVSLGSVSLISALLGVQFVFILILALIFRQKIPGVSENVKGKILLGKLIGIALIGFGFLMLFK